MFSYDRQKVNDQFMCFLLTVQVKQQLIKKHELSLLLENILSSKVLKSSH